MAFDFPASPTVGQPFAQGNVVYTWDGEKWVAGQLPNTGAAIEVGDTPPPAPTDKTLWYESDTGELYLRYNDGNSTQWIQINHGGMPDAPQDGNEYVRVNGVWRLSKQTFVAGASFNNSTGHIFTPPAGAKIALVKAALWQPSGNQTWMRWSADGVTWPAAASDYSYAGWVHYSGSASPGFAVTPSTNAAYLPLAVTNDNASIPTMIELMQVVSKPAGVYTVKWSGHGYNSAAAQTMTQFNMTGWSNNGAIAGAASLKFQIFPASVAYSAGSWMTVEWLY